MPLTPRGAEHVGLCPWHDDSKPSLTVGQFKGRSRFRCWACGESGDALDFLERYLNLSKAEALKVLENGGAGLSPQIAPRVLKRAPPWRSVAPPASLDAPDCIRRDGTQPLSMHPYLNAAAELLGVAARYPEGIWYWTYGSRGEGDVAKWALQPFSSPLPWYGLVSVLRYPKRQVLVFEDEQSVDAAEELFPDFVAVTWPGGRNSLDRVDWAALAGRRLVLVPTGDAAGRDCMETAAGLAYAAGVAEVKGIRVDLIPGTAEALEPVIEAPEGWCLAGALASGWKPATALSWALANRMQYPDPNPAPPEAVPFVGQPPFPQAEAPPVAKPPVVAGPSVEISTPIIGVVEASGAVRKPRRPPAIEPEPSLPPEFSEFALAEAFSEAQPDWRYTAASKEWHAWAGTRWRLDEKGSVFHICRHVLQEACNAPEANELTRAARQRIASFKMVLAVLALAGADPRHAVARSDWDCDPYMLGTPAGVVDLRTGKIIEASREQLISRSTSVAPAPGPTPLFDRVLTHAARGAEDMRGYLMRWLGYLLTGDCSEEKFLFLHGPGGSGKSTLVNLAADILGDYAIACKPGMFKDVKHEGHAEEIARLCGARMAHASETEEGSRFNEGRIKWLTGRDKLSARFMRENSFDFTATHKIVIHGNHRPGLKSVGAEMRRRICLVEWPELPEDERDARLKDNLRTEYPGILARMIAAGIEWQDAGLGAPESVTSATDDYLRAEDTVSAFCEDVLSPEAGASTGSGETYRRYRDWISAEGEHYTLSHKRFSQKMQDRGYRLVKRGGVKLFEGFRLRLEPVPAAPSVYS